MNDIVLMYRSAVVVYFVGGLLCFGIDILLTGALRRIKSQDHNIPDADAADLITLVLWVRWFFRGVLVVLVCCALATLANQIVLNVSENSKIDRSFVDKSQTNFENHMKGNEK